MGLCKAEKCFHAARVATANAHAHCSPQKLVSDIGEQSETEIQLKMWGLFLIM